MNALQKAQQARRAALPSIGTPEGPGEAVTAAPGQSIRLGPVWRVRVDRVQWVLERARPEPGRDGVVLWDASAFCVTRAGLLRCIAERAGRVAPAALAAIRAWPHLHPGLVAHAEERRRKAPGGAV